MTKVSTKTPHNICRTPQNCLHYPKTTHKCLHPPISDYISVYAHTHIKRKVWHRSNPMASLYINVSTRIFHFLGHKRLTYVKRSCYNGFSQAIDAPYNPTHNRHPRRQQVASNDRAAHQYATRYRYLLRLNHNNVCPRRSGESLAGNKRNQLQRASLNRPWLAIYSFDRCG